ncbi:hypothetical protein QQS21_003239 [Conoideocrella luteorostrata]|uniref:Uncharacterized protein n=1 Tax=Conoideocrella luteorostrata TaxID=1105319 RepID=A0AAJ0CUH5_9HYPO|nr:hypothetical protein QQS21_003239 [Conoideocrella luteorostrata]
MLAVESGDAHLKVKGLQTYTNSVRQMAMAIRDTKRANSDAVIAAVKLAVCYEILFGLDGDQYEQMGRISQIVGWYGHVDGQLALFQQRGPEALVSGPGHRLFVGGRLDLVLVSISRRKRSPLSASRWMTQPWELIPKSKMDEIVDILIEITGHIEDLDILRAHAGDVATADELRDTLVYRCMQTYRTLVAWTETVGDALYAFDPNVVGLPLPTPSTDEDYELLHLSIVYWITSLFLYSTWEFALQQNIQPSYLTTGVSCIDSPPHLDSPQSDTQISDTSSINYARRIAWSIHLFFAPGTGAWGANAALLPLGFALRFLMVKESGSPFSEERKLLVSCFKKPFMGTFVGRFLRNFQEEESHPDLRNIPGIQGMEMRARSWWLKGYGT